VFDSFLSPREGRMWARPIPSYIVDILSTFVGPSVCLFIEKLVPMSSDFDKHGEEAHTHPLVENLDDAGEYISVWGMSKEGILALPHSIRGYCHESCGIRENHNGLVMGEEMLKSQTCCRNFGPAGRAATDASPNPAAPTSFGIVRGHLLWYREGSSLAITVMFCLEFACVFRLLVSMRKVASEHAFCVLIYMNSYIFHICFILFISL